FIPAVRGHQTTATRIAPVADTAGVNGNAWRSDLLLGPTSGTDVTFVDGSGGTVTRRLAGQRLFPSVLRDTFGKTNTSGIVVAQTLAQLPFKILEEVIRQLRSTRNDIIRYGVWNIRNVSDDEFNKTDDRKLLGYFRQDLLETRFLSKGRRIDLIQLWKWFD